MEPGVMAELTDVRKATVEFVAAQAAAGTNA
jgi:hypothetical protein